jgi:ABC-type uncharacterized transport system substrate-binding protein
MKNRFFLAGVLLLAAGLGLASAATATEKKGKLKVLVVSSYHREYLSSSDGQRGCAHALRDFGYFDNAAQSEEFLAKDSAESSRMVIKAFWMDAKRKNEKEYLRDRAISIYGSAKAFNPDLIFLADDEAGEYFGKIYLNTPVPVVFWGFNDNPMKYGLIETAERPGHNVTGVYESGYYVESLRFLKRLAPQIKTIAVLSDATVSGRTHYKSLHYLADKGLLPFKIKETVSTSEYSVWKSRALDLQNKVDAFYVVQFSGLKDDQGQPVPIQEAARWYTRNIRIPEATRGHFVKAGLLSAADDSMYKQGYEAVRIAMDIIEKGMDPAVYPARTPARGPLLVNKMRAAQLGIALTPETGAEEYVETDSSYR